MTRITPELVRRRAEHNDGELSSLEELSLHQQDIEKIEHLQRWCPRMRILYLQGNLISKIENVGRLRELEYLNLAMNNLESVGGLERCHSLRKLDLTANFVYDLTSLLSLQDLSNFRELFLTGNPCTHYRGYRAWVICNLPSLQELDGTLITRSERLQALQELALSDHTVRIDQLRALEKRAKEKAEYEDKANEREEENEEDEEEWWKGASEATPEARLEIHHHIARRREKHHNTNSNTTGKKEREVRLFSSDGRPLNVNAAKVEFQLTDDEENNCFVLDVHTYKYLDTSLVTCDVEPHYVRVIVRGKVLQLVLPEEVRPGQSTARRSRTTGHLLVTTPKLADPWRPVTTCPKQMIALVTSKSTCPSRNVTEAPVQADDSRGNKYLEVGDTSQGVDYTNIVPAEKGEIQPTSLRRLQLPDERPNSPDFEDDPDVPPLE